GSSINGQQWVRGSPAFWNYIAEQTGDNIWSAEHVYESFKKLEKPDFTQSKEEVGDPNEQNCSERGYVDTRLAPKKPTSMDQKFVEATSKALNIEKIFRYNNFDTPMGPFTRWDLTQNPEGQRESSDLAFLPQKGMS